MMETSHIWLGIFRSEAALDQYFAENYDEEDDAPINQFAEDQGETFCDLDGVERSFDDAGDLRKLIDGHSYSSSFVEQVIAAAKTQDLSRINTFIMADGEEISQARGVESQHFVLWFIGTYKCDVESPAIQTSDQGPAGD